MATIAYIKIEDSDGNVITQDASSEKSAGTNWQEGHDEESMVIKFESNAIVPRDPTSGMVNGPRRHEPSTFIKPLDKASPVLWEALGGSKKLKATMRFFRVDGKGEQEHYYTIEWDEVVLVEGRIILPDTYDVANDARPHLEEWSFTYAKCDWTHEASGTSGAYDYRKAPGS